METKWLLGLVLVAAAIGLQKRGDRGPASPPHAVVPASERVLTVVDDGSDVTLTDYTAPDTWTLFEYTAEW